MRSLRRALLWASVAGMWIGCSVNQSGLTDDGGVHADGGAGAARRRRRGGARRERRRQRGHGRHVGTGRRRHGRRAGGTAATTGATAGCRRQGGADGRRRRQRRRPAARRRRRRRRQQRHRRQRRVRRQRRRRHHRNGQRPRRRRRSGGTAGTGGAAGTTVEAAAPAAGRRDGGRGRMRRSSQRPEAAARRDAAATVRPDAAAPSGRGGTGGNPCAAYPSGAKAFVTPTDGPRALLLGALELADLERGAAVVHAAERPPRHDPVRRGERVRRQRRAVLDVVLRHLDRRDRRQDRRRQNGAGTYKLGDATRPGATATGRRASPTGSAIRARRGQTCTCDHRAVLSSDGTWNDRWQDNSRSSVCEATAN